MKKLDIIAEILLIIGGLNWGLIGLADYDILGHLFGHFSALTRIIYCLVGIAAIYHIVLWKPMMKRRK